MPSKENVIHQLDVPTTCDAYEKRINFLSHLKTKKTILYFPLFHLLFIHLFLPKLIQIGMNG